MFGEPPTINDLSNEILCMIFEHVSPYQDLDRCRLVCKRWLDQVTFVRSKRKRSVINNILSKKIAVDVINNDKNFGLLSICRCKSDFYLLGRDRGSYAKDFVLYKFKIDSKTLEKIAITGDIPEEEHQFHLVNYKDDLVYFITLDDDEQNDYEYSDDEQNDEIEMFVCMYSYKIKLETWVKQYLPVPFKTLCIDFMYLVHEDNVIFCIKQCKEFHILNLITMSWWKPEQVNPHLYSEFYFLEYVYTENKNLYFLEQKAGVIWKLKVNMVDKNEVWTWTKIVIENWHGKFKILHCVSSSVLIDNFLICIAATNIGSHFEEFELIVPVLDFSRASEEKKVKLELIKPYTCSTGRKILFINFEGVNFTVLGCPCYYDLDCYLYDIIF